MKSQRVDVLQSFTACHHISLSLFACGAFEAVQLPEPLLAHMLLMQCMDELTVVTVSVQEM